MTHKQEPTRQERAALSYTANTGFIKMILLIVIGLIVLGFFGYNLRAIISIPTVHDNLVYIWELVVKLWNTFLATPVLWVWEKITGFLAK